MQKAKMILLCIVCICAVILSACTAAPDKTESLPPSKESEQTSEVTTGKDEKPEVSVIFRNDMPDMMQNAIVPQVTVIASSDYDKVGNDKQLYAYSADLVETQPVQSSQTKEDMIQRIAGQTGIILYTDYPIENLPFYNDIVFLATCSQIDEMLGETFDGYVLWIEQLPRPDQYDVMREEYGIDVPSSRAYAELANHSDWREKVFPGDDLQVELSIPDPRVTE